MQVSTELLSFFQCQFTLGNILYRSKKQWALPVRQVDPGGFDQNPNNFT